MLSGFVFFPLIRTRNAVPPLLARKIVGVACDLLKPRRLSIVITKLGASSVGAKVFLSAQFVRRIYGSDNLSP